MPRVRKIRRNPDRSSRNYFVVDACFLVEKYLPINSAGTENEKQQSRACKRWWKEIDRQLDESRARVYVPDVCIAEAFKVLARRKYQDKIFRHATEYKRARERLSRDVTLDHKTLKAQNRVIKFHDLTTTRDIIIAIDRFYELFMKHDCNVSVVDLILVAGAKYLMDFHDARRSQLHIVTLDRALYKGTKKIAELPNAYDPTQPTDDFERVFQ